MIHAHSCAAGAPHKRDGQAAQALGRSCGGFSSKIHLAIEGLGNPLCFLLTAGQHHDRTQAEALIERFAFDNLIGDRAYDDNTLRQRVVAKGAQAVIPLSANRKQDYDYDHHLYKERHLRVRKNTTSRIIGV